MVYSAGGGARGVGGSGALGTVSSTLHDPPDPQDLHDPMTSEQIDRSPDSADVPSRHLHAARTSCPGSPG